MTGVALLAAAALAARAQDAPPAPKEAPPPVAVRLPDPPAESPDATDATLPRALVPLGGHLVALPDVPPSLRCDADGLWKTTGGGNALAGVRLGPEASGRDPKPDEDTARRLLALDVDGRRPDAGTWLAAVDPRRCAVRVRVPRGAALPALPDGLHMVEIVVEPGAVPGAAGPGADALPALPDARRIALYGAAVDAEGAAKLREAHPAALVTTTWREPLAAATAVGCDRVRLQVGGATPRVVDLATGDAAATLVRNLVLDEATSGISCPSEPALVLELARGDRVLARLSFHDGDVLTWLDGPWPGDARLTADAARTLGAALAEADVKAPVEQVERKLAADVRRRARDARQDELLGAEGANALRLAEESEAGTKAAGAIRDAAAALRLAGAAGGEREDRVTAAAWGFLDVAAPVRLLDAAAAAPDDAELQRGFALWLWSLANRDFLVEEEKPLEGRTAKLLAGDDDPTVRVVAVRAAKETGDVAALRGLLAKGDGTAPLPCQVAAAVALADLRDAESLPKVRELLAAITDAAARADVEAALRRATEETPDAPKDEAPKDDAPPKDEPAK